MLPHALGRRPWTVNNLNCTLTTLGATSWRLYAKRKVEYLCSTRLHDLTSQNQELYSLEQDVLILGMKAYDHWMIEVDWGWLRLALSKGPNRVGVSFPSPEDGNRSSFRNVVFSSIQNSGRWTTSRNSVILKYWFTYRTVSGVLCSL
jgi:hypothetical protein